MWQDLINGLFESAGCFFIFLHVWKILKDKKVRGVSAIAVSYFTLWGFWNCYYYPHLDQWISFVGGTAIALMNAVWVGLIIYYLRCEKTTNSAKEIIHKWPEWKQQIGFAPMKNTERIESDNH